MARTTDTQTGASPAPHEGSTSLSSPASAISKITGNPRELADIAEKLLRDDTIRRALLAIAPVAAQEVAIKYAKTKDVSFAAGPRGLSIEIPQGVRSAHTASALLQAIAREFTITALSQVARHADTPPEAPPLLCDLVERVSGKRPEGEGELSQALRPLLQSAIRELPKLIAECDKRATRCASLRTTTLSATTHAIDQTFDQLARLRALGWLSQGSQHLEAFDAIGRRCVEGIQIRLVEGWENALNTGSAEGASSTVQSYSYLLDSLKKAGFTDRCPSWIPSASEQSAPKTLEQRTAILRRGVAGSRGTSRQPSFVADFISRMPEEVVALSATAQLENTIREWTPPADNATHAILVDLLDTVPEVVKDLAIIKTLPAALPQSLTRFVECVARLKHHGGVEGLESHCIIVAPGTWLEKMTNEKPTEGGRLHRELQSSAHANIREYLNLVALVATWPHRSLEARKQIMSAFSERGVNAVARALLTSVGEATYMVYSVLSGNHTYEEMSPKLTSQRLLDLAVAADTLRSSVATSEIARHLSEAAHNTLPNLATARRVLEINTLPWPENLKHLNELPTEFDTSPIGEMLRGLSGTMRTAMSESAREAIKNIESGLSKAYADGAVEAFTAVAPKAVELAELLGATDENRARLVELLDGWLLKYINLVHDGVEHSLTLHEGELGATSVQQASSEGAIEMMHFFVDALRPIYQLISQHREATQPARLNHMLQIVAELFQRYPRVGAAYIEHLLTEIPHDGESELTSQRAAFVRRVPGISNKLSREGREGVRALRSLELGA